MDVINFVVIRGSVSTMSSFDTSISSSDKNPVGVCLTNLSNVTFNYNEKIKTMTKIFNYLFNKFKSDKLH